MLALSLLTSLPTWLLFVAALGIAWVLWRGQSGTAVSILRDANQVLARKLNELEQRSQEQARTIAELESRTDIALALAPVIEAIDAHEKRSEARQASDLRVLQLIADRLGPENGG